MAVSIVSRTQFMVAKKIYKIFLNRTANLPLGCGIYSFDS